MPERLTFYLILQLLICASAFAQSTTPAETTAERTFWDHNGSVVYLVANGSSGEFYYQRPRLGMLEAGARPDSLLFSGQINNGQFAERRMSSTRNAGKFRSKSKGPFSRMAEELR
jgi:hypothetical protein